MNKYIYTFDIFDTCLIRTCGFPHNVFALLAEQIIGDKSDSIKNDFVNIRIQAERNARGKKQSEITLKDIYDECDFTGVTELDKNLIAKEEIKIEQKVIVPVDSIKKKITELHKNNINIYYISDMYLSETAIKDLLIKNGFWKEGDKLYVSCEYGKTKQKGSLFELVAQENNISYRLWNHWGDNYHSDYLIPKKYGIKSHLVSHKFSKYENNILKLYPNLYNLVNQRLAGVQKAVRLSVDVVEDKYLNIASNITVPILVLFVNNILEDAKKKGIKRLFFLARDGRLPYYIATQFKELYPDIEIKYLYTSRSALYFPGINSITIENIYNLLSPLVGKNIYEAFIDRTNIDISDYMPESLKGKLVQNEDEGKELIVRLFSNSKLQQLLINEFNKQRNIIIEYFRQEGLANNSTKSAIVDIRGTRKCNHVINSILLSNNYNKVYAYYFEVTENRIRISEAGEYYADIYTERLLLGNKEIKSISNLYSVIEQFFCITGDLRTIKYEKVNGKIVPVYEVGSDSKNGKYIYKVHEKIAKTYISHYIVNNLYLYTKDISFLIYNNLIKFAYIPYKLDLESIKNIKVNDNQFHYINLINKYSIIDVLRKKSNKMEWYRGSLIYSIYKNIGEVLGRWLIERLNR